jgi:MFS family permease
MLLLFTAGILYNIDRAIVGVLAEPIRATFAISDVQMGLLLGLAYSLLSGLLGLVLGTFVDRHVRRTVLAGSIILWSLATIMGGLSPGFGTFFVSRALVGLGEAALAPAAISLIADMFPAHRRGRALGGYYLGAVLGSALSSVIPGWIVGANLHLTLPLFGTVVPWRSAFVLCGSIGPIVGLLLLTVKEPIRRGARNASGAPTMLGDKLRYMVRQRAVMGPLYLGICLYYLAFIGIGAWTAAFLTRNYHLTLADFSGKLGLMMLIAGGSGYIAGGLISDLAVGKRQGGKLILLAILPIVALPCAFATFAPTATGALVALAALSFATPMLNVAMNGSIQELVPNDMRGFSYALLMVVAALPAGAGGPLAIAYVTEHVLGDPALIGHSFLIVGLPCFLLASASFAFAYRAFRRAPHDSEIAGVVRSSHA